MSAPHKQTGGEPSERPWRAAKRAKLRRAGTPGAPDDSGQAPSPAAAQVGSTRLAPPNELANAPPQSPLDFALAFMRDTSKPDALRVSVAKAALPYVHGRWCQVDSDPRDAKPKLPPPFDLPDPYNSLRVDWRDALERAGLVRPAVAANEAVRAVAPASTSVPPPLLPPREDSLIRHGRASAARPGHPRLSSHGIQDVDGRNKCGHDENKERALAAEAITESADARAAPAPLTEAQEHALEKRATLAEGRLREAQHHARDMEQRALAAEALIAGRR